MTREFVTLVDIDGNLTGQMEKLAAHQNGGRLHLGFSILIFNPNGEMLLQKRAHCKYHFAELWSNSCCGHPRPGEEIATAAARRLSEEFGFTTTLTQVRTLSYQADDPHSGLTEKEHLTVFTGCYQQDPRPNPEEISNWRWQDMNGLERRLKKSPGEYTPWFLILCQQIDLPAIATSACSGQIVR